MSFKIENGTKALLCTVVAGIATIIGGIYSQREQIKKLEEIDRAYHDKSTETENVEEEV